MCANDSNKEVTSRSVKRYSSVDVIECEALDTVSAEMFCKVLITTNERA